MAAAPIRVNSKQEALNWLRCLDIYELLSNDVSLALEVAYTLIKACKQYNLPITSDILLLVKDLPTAVELNNTKMQNPLIILVPPRQKA